MLYRAIYVSDAVGTAGGSILSIAQILGVSDANNRRDHLTGVLMFHGGQWMQVIEGTRADLDRLIRRLQADPRHRDLTFLVDGPAPTRRFGTRPMAQADVTDGVLEILNDRLLRALDLAEAEAVFLASEAALDMAG